MKRMYEAPVLFVDEFAADTMIASGDDENKNNAAAGCWAAAGYNGADSKNGNPGNNQNCWGYDATAGELGCQDDLCLGHMMDGSPMAGDPCH